LKSAQETQGTSLVEEAYSSVKKYLLQRYEQDKLAGEKSKLNPSNRGRFQNCNRGPKMRIYSGTREGLHAFRNLSASAMDRLNEPLKLRQQRIAHSDPEMRIGVYGAPQQWITAFTGEELQVKFLPESAENSLRD
jgi:hypothetical protein